MNPDVDQRRWGAWAGGLALLSLLLAAGTGLWILHQRSRRQQVALQQARAEQERERGRVWELAQALSEERGRRAYQLASSQAGGYEALALGIQAVHEPRSRGQEPTAGAMQALLAASQSGGYALGPPLVHDSMVEDAHFSPDGRRVISAGWSRRLWQWEVSSGKLLAVLDEEQGGAVTPLPTPAPPPPPEETQPSIGQGYYYTEYSAPTLSLSADGKRAVLSSDRSLPSLWDLESGRRLRTLEDLGCAYGATSFSPSGDRLLSWGRVHDQRCICPMRGPCSLPHQAALWDGQSGARLASLGERGEFPASAAFSQSGQRIALADARGQIRLFEQGRLLTTLRAHSGTVHALSFSPDGSRLASVGADRVTRIFEVPGGRLLYSLYGHSDEVLSAQFSPDGGQLVTASRDGLAWLWQWSREGVAQGQQLVGHSGAVLSARFSPDGSCIVTASSDGTARLWQGHTGAAQGTLRGHSAPVRSARFSPGGSRVVTSSADHTVRLWRGCDSSAQVTLRGHRDRILQARLVAADTRILTRSLDQTVRLWDAESGRSVLTLTGQQGRIDDVCLSPDGERVATASDDGMARLWDGRSGALLATQPIATVPRAALSCTADGQRIATQGAGNTLLLLDGRTFRRLATLSGHSEQINDFAFSPDGHRLATASLDESARLWDGQTGQLQAILRGHTSRVVDVTFSPDGRRLVTAVHGSGPGMLLWDAERGTLLKSLSAAPMASVAPLFSPDGQRLLIFPDQQSIAILQGQTGEPIATLAGHGDFLTSASYSADSRLIVTAGGDHILRLFEAAGGKPLAELRSHRNSIPGASFSPDGRLLASGSADGTLRLWEVASGRELWMKYTPTRSGFGPPQFSRDGQKLLVYGADPHAQLLTIGLPALLKRGCHLLSDQPEFATVLSACPPEPAGR